MNLTLISNIDSYVIAYLNKINYMNYRINYKELQQFETSRTANASLLAVKINKNYSSL